MNDLLCSNKVRTVLWIVGTTVVFLVIFGLGTAIGYRRALFVSHGVTGNVIDVASSVMSIEGLNGGEQSVVIAPDTVIREMDAAITIADITAGDRVTVIGWPNDLGQIEARFIRVFGDSPSFSPPPVLPGNEFK